MAGIAQDGLVCLHKTLSPSVRPTRPTLTPRHASLMPPPPPSARARPPLDRGCAAPQTTPTKQAEQQHPVCVSRSPAHRSLLFSSSASSKPSAPPLTPHHNTRTDTHTGTGNRKQPASSSSFSRNHGPERDAPDGGAHLRRPYQLSAHRAGMCGGEARRDRHAMVRRLLPPSPHGITHHAPRTQVLDVKKIQPNPGQAVAAERFRLVISDGTHYLQAMLATQLNHLVAGNQIQPNGLLSLQVRPSTDKAAWPIHALPGPTDAHSPAPPHHHRSSSATRCRGRRSSSSSAATWSPPPSGTRSATPSSTARPAAAPPWPWAAAAARPPRRRPRSTP